MWMTAFLTGGAVDECPPDTDRWLLLARYGGCMFAATEQGAGPSERKPAWRRAGSVAADVLGNGIVTQRWLWQTAGSSFGWPVRRCTSLTSSPQQACRRSTAMDLSFRLGADAGHGLQALWEGGEGVAAGRSRATAAGRTKASCPGDVFRPGRSSFADGIDHATFQPDTL